MPATIVPTCTTDTGIAANPAVPETVARTDEPSTNAPAAALIRIPPIAMVTAPALITGVMPANTTDAPLVTVAAAGSPAAWLYTIPGQGKVLVLFGGVAAEPHVETVPVPATSAPAV
jgi:hypothetical protein